MSVYTIELNDDVIQEKLGNILNDALNRQLRHKTSDVNDTIAAAVKELVYSRKDEIIEMTVDRAAKEIARKGLVKLMERAANNG